MSSKTPAADPVTAAESEAAEAEGLVDALEERVRDGDDSVTVEEIAGARELGRFARLRAEAARRKADKARTAARLDACQQIHNEIQAHAGAAGPEFVQLLQAAQDACTAFAAAVGERESKLHDWKRRMDRLNVPQHTDPGAPSADHARVGHHPAGNAVIAGHRRVAHVDAGRWLSVMLTAVRVEHGLANVEVPTYLPTGDLYAPLAEVDAETAPPEGVHWYRNQSGALSYRKDAWTDEELRRLGLRKVSRKDALA